METRGKTNEIYDQDLLDKMSRRVARKNFGTGVSRRNKIVLDTFFDILKTRRTAD